MKRTVVKDEGFPVQIMECLKKVPMPVAGVALAVATLGGLFHLYHLDIQPILGIVSALLLMLPLLQCLCVKGQFKQYMSTPVMASTIGTVSMALIVLSGYIKPFFGLLALAVFLVGGTLHTLLVGLHIVSCSVHRSRICMQAGSSCMLAMLQFPLYLLRSGWENP